MKKIAFMPDTHFPYHDKGAYRVFLHAMKEFEPDILFILGDAMDFYQVSFHAKDPRRMQTFEKEVASANRELDKISRLEIPVVHFVEGNHEYRLERYLWQNSPELVDLVTVPSLLRLEERGWSYTPYREHINVGKLYVTHDCGRSGKYAVQQSLADYGANVVIGHTHRLGYNVVRTLRGESHVAMCPGWLGDFDSIDYMHRAKMKDWSHGFGVGYMESNGNVHLRPVPIVQGRCIVEGVVVR